MAEEEENEEDWDEEDDYERRPSVTLPQLGEPEKDFFELVTKGSVAEAEKYIQAHPDYNINATDFLGVTPLHIAVQEKNIPMIKFLLAHPDIEPGDAHLHAVRDNELRIVAMILNRLSELAPGSEQEGVMHSVDFPEQATPVAVAAIYGHYELIQYLIETRRHSFHRPHPPYCNCQDPCREERDAYDTLTLHKKRMFLYQAVINPAYICQTENDPILAAFNLSRELKKAAEFDREFYQEYMQLSEEVSQFATDLIALARKSYEVEIILKRTAGFARMSRFVFPRLLLALDYKQKSFVAHPNVQKVLQETWIEEWYDWRVRQGWLKCLTVLLRIFLLPVIFFVILFIPNTKIGKFFQSPVNKFLHSVASYLFFLFVVFQISNIDKCDQLRGPPETGYVVLLVIYIVAYVWGAVRLCFVHGPKRYFMTSRNLYEILMLSLFILSILFWIAAAIDIRINGQRELERKYWHMYDPTLIAEGIYCLAAIMAFFRLMFICQLNYHLGPLQLSLGKMIHDVTKFIVIFTIIIFAFSAGLCKLYQYYNDMVQTDTDTKMKTQQVNSFVDFSSSLKTLFWAIFCMSPIESADVVIENLPGKNDSDSIINHHTFTEVVGYIAFASFEFIAVVVVLNMLIACMSNTFTKVTDNVIVEWTFGRTEVYMDFMLTSSLPAPFNLIPTIGAFLTIAEYIKLLMKPTETKRVRWDFAHCFYIENSEEQASDYFPQVMTEIVQRYFRQKAKENGETDIEKLKKELVEVRGLLREALSPA